LRTINPVEDTTRPSYPRLLRAATTIESTAETEVYVTDRIDCNVSTLEAGSLRYLERMTYPQVERLAARTDLALLPVGPPEAHGPHLPVGTDLIAASELCERAARELAARGVECLIAPLLPYCLAEVARPFPGTITVRAEVVAALVADICGGLADSGFRRTLVVSGHAEEENLLALRAGAGQAKNDGVFARVSRWYEDALPNFLYLLEEDHPHYDLHAGEWETALVLLRAPDLVDRAALERLPPNWGTRDISGRRAAGARTFPELGAPEAYCGDPRLATAITGERLYAALGSFVAREGASLPRAT
jgi:creatinine amidohydrolase